MFMAEVLIFSCAFLLTSAAGQTTVDIPTNDPVIGSFNVQIRRYEAPYDIDSAKFECIGSVISLSNVLTVASCVVDRPPSDIIVAVGSTVMSWKEDNAQLTLISEIAIHPKYHKTQPLVANLAVLATKTTLDKSFFIPRSLSPTGLTLDESYSMIGFLGMSASLQRTFIVVHSHENSACDSRYPTAFCSRTKFDVQSCGGVLGSPVFSGSDTEEVQGIVIRGSFCESQQAVSNFHSIAEYRDWIKEVSGSETLKVSLSLIALVTALLIKNLLS